MWWLIGLLVLFFWARKAGPAKEKEGGRVTPPCSFENKSELIVATYNIQTGKDQFGKRDINRAAAVIAQADIVGIQEVYAQTWLNKLKIGQSQTQALARQNGFAAIFSATRRRWFREHRGNALLSRLPIMSWQVRRLPDYTGKSYRNMTIAEFEFKAQKLVVINTHLHTTKGRQEQLSKVFEEFEKYPRAVLMGDFNSTLDEPILQAQLKNKDITDATAIACQKTGRIDWILTKGLKVERGLSLPKGVSDHPYYQVTLS